MAWVVDSCVLIDIAMADPKYCQCALETLNACKNDGLVAAPVSLIEVSPTFGGDIDSLEKFARLLDIRCVWEWTSIDTKLAFEFWHKYVESKRKSTSPQKKHVVADILIGSFAARTGGLITRNKADFEDIFGDIPIIDPSE